MHPNNKRLKENQVVAKAVQHAFWQIIVCTWRIFPHYKSKKDSKAACASVYGKEAENLVCGTFGPVCVTPEVGVDEASKNCTFNLGPSSESLKLNR